MRRLVRDLNNVYRHFPALHEQDCDGSRVSNGSCTTTRTTRCLRSFARRATGQFVLVVCNFTPLVRQSLPPGRAGCEGTYREIINTDGAVVWRQWRWQRNGAETELDRLAWNTHIRFRDDACRRWATVMWVLA
jgi:1,4-alpha-glucan branching enzyme